MSTYPGTDLAWMAAKLVGAALDEFRRLNEFEQRCFQLGWRDAEVHRTSVRVVYNLFQQWAEEAQQILDRVRSPSPGGSAETDVEELARALDITRARLKLTPEMIERSTEHARRGETIPAEVLRNELRARLRA